MSEPDAKRPVINELPVWGRTWNDEPTRLICMSLALAIVFVALRIVNVWP